MWAAATLTLLLYIGLPYLERLTAPDESEQTVRPVSTVAPPPPTQPPPEPMEREQTEEPRAPELDRPQQRMQLPSANLQLQTGIDDVAGDIVVGFSTTDFVGSMEDQIFSLGALDEPPRPVVSLRPQYPPQARLRQQEGYVNVEFVVNADGSVSDPVVVDAQPQDIFDQAAIQAVRRWRFSPGIREGEAVAVRVRQRVEFRLQ